MTTDLQDGLVPPERVWLLRDPSVHEARPDGGQVLAVLTVAHDDGVLLPAWSSLEALLAHDPEAAWVAADAAFVELLRQDLHADVLLDPPWPLLP